MPVEGGSGNADTFANLGIQPLLVDFLQGELAEAVNGVHQPDVLLEKGVGFHGGLVFRCRRSKHCSNINRAGENFFSCRCNTLLKNGFPEAVNLFTSEYC